MKRKPDFSQLCKILEKKKSDYPVPFEFIIHEEYIQEAGNKYKNAAPGSIDFLRLYIEAYHNLGFDYAVVPAWHTQTLSFPKNETHSMASKSQNEGAIITDWKSFERYTWPDPQNGNYDFLDELKNELPEGMKLIGMSDGGVLENATEIIGFENLCMMYLVEPDLTRQIFDHIGERLLKYYEIISRHPAIGAMMGNDDWGFKTQTMFPPDMMRQYVIPWHKKIVEAVHKNNKPIILHSCGNVKEVMEDIISIGYDGKHSYEDQIYKVENAWDWWSDRIAIIGGIDVDFLYRTSEEEIKNRVRNLIEKTGCKSYAVGSGNSITPYLPFEKFKAMLDATLNY